MIADRDRMIHPIEQMRPSFLRQRRELAHESGRRALFTWSPFWVVCRNKRCRRKRRCIGDVALCEKIFWPVLPGSFRIRIVALEKAVEENLTMQAAGESASSPCGRWRNDEFLAGRTPD